MRQKQSSAAAVAELFEHIVRSIHTSSFTLGLNPAQWNALRYLHSASDSSRSVKAFARFQMVSASTASQTIAALVRKRLVTKERDESDGRGVVLALTPGGRDMLQRDPLRALAEAFARLDDSALAAAAQIGADIARNMFLVKNGKDVNLSNADCAADEGEDPHHRR